NNMAVATDAFKISDIDGVLKPVFDELQDVYKHNYPLQRDFGFAKVGKERSFPVLVTMGHGATYDDGTGGAFSLANPIPAVTKEAKVTPTIIVDRQYAAWSAISRTAGGGEVAVTPALALVMSNLMDSHAYRQECSHMYGGQSLVRVTGISGTGTARVLTLDNASFAPGIVAKMQNAQIDCYDDSVGTTKINTNAVISVTNMSISDSDKTLTVSGNSTDLGALDTEVGGGDAHIFFANSKGLTSTGLATIAGSTGTLFNIAGGTYHMWQANNHTVNGQLSFGAGMAGLQKPFNRGVVGEDYTLYCSGASWHDLNNDAAALLQVPSQKDSFKIGTKEISYVSAIGSLTVKPSQFCKAGEAYAVLPRLLKRIGSAEVGKGVPGAPGNANWL
ncbi:MAG: hypothetical protein KDA17_01380, partial [Candidatus Saccharibacteria bacterium]|nr:hypothetical protein [Candidatus Saccharibacteria bacterium]